jgi:hypothetical protein
MVRHLSVIVSVVVCMAACRFAIAQQNGAGPLEWNGSLDSATALAMFYGEHMPVQSALAQMGGAPMNVFPAAMPGEISPSRPLARRTADASKDSPEHDVATVQKDPIHYGGEVGTYYGHSSGKFGGDDFGSYLVGTVGTDKFQITAGASYEESNFRLPRRFR